MAATELASFKAGKLQLDGKMLKPDSRKGMLRLVQGDEGLVHLQWSERGAQADAAAAGSCPEDDIVVFPEECMLSQIGSSRNYVLKFPAEPDRNMFFWMQEPDAAADTALVDRFNRALKGDVDMQDATGPEPAATTAATAALPASSGRPADGLAASLSSALAAAMAAAGPRGSSNASAAEQLSASLLARMAARGGMAGTSGGISQRQALEALAADQGPSLGQVLKPDVLAPLLSDPEALQRLAEHLPQEQRTQSGLLDTIASQSFRQQLSSFSHALQTGQLNLMQFGLEAKGFSVTDFLQSVQDSVDKERQAQGAQAAQGGQNAEASKEADGAKGT